MHLSLDQARALEALARHGTFQAAAKVLRKRHTAVLYAINALEEQTELTLLDRRGYRTKLTSAGERVLQQCQKLLSAERDLVNLCVEIKNGWEPSLKVVFDGVFPAEPILKVVGHLSAERAPTKIQVFTDFLAGVEAVFEREEADLMISVLPAKNLNLASRKLQAILARMVAHPKHPLAQLKRILLRDDLAQHILLTVRGSDPRLHLSTEQLEQGSTIHLNDFSAKKAAILQGIGVGWLPEHLIAREIKRGELVALKMEAGSSHAFEPRLYYREGQRFGRAITRLIEALVVKS